MANSKDFKSPDGNWVRYYPDETNKRVYTRAGMIWGNICNRTKVDGACWKKNPCYIGCTNEFKNFSTFAEWCQNQIGYNSNFQADKDLLSGDCKIYSEDTVVFVPQEVNKVLLNRSRARGEFPQGVSWSTERSLFAAYCNNGKGKTVGLGRFNTVEEAFYTYKKFKECVIKDVANKWRDEIDPRAYEALMSYQVEITD